MNKPSGRYKCRHCSAEWSGDELQFGKDNQAVCPTCSGRVRKVEQTTGASGQWKWDAPPGFAKNRNKPRR